MCEIDDKNSALYDLYIVSIDIQQIPCQYFCVNIIPTFDIHCCCRKIEWGFSNPLCECLAQYLM